MRLSADGIEWFKSESDANAPAAKPLGRMPIVVASLVGRKGTTLSLVSGRSSLVLSGKAVDIDSWEVAPNGVEKWAQLRSLFLCLLQFHRSIF